MLNKIFGEKNTIKRSLIISYIIALVIVIVSAALAFYLFVNKSTITKLVSINIASKEDMAELIQIMRRSIIIIILSAIVIGIILMGIMNSKIVKPIKEITKATKKVATGDFNVKLKSTRLDEIGELTNNFNKMVKGLRSTSELQNDFIDNVSHEIKTPITSIQGFAKLLEDENLSKEEKKEYINIINEESERLLNLSNNILKLSKLQNQEKIDNKVDVNISEQIRKEVAALEPRWREKNIKINANLEEVHCLGDEDLLLQVWTNLLDNAIKFSNKNGELNLVVKQQGKNILVKIQDNGIGMTEEETERIFEKFYQTDRSHSEKGSGLGLSIVKRIIELSGGEIQLKSEKGKGTTFLINLK